MQNQENGQDLGLLFIKHGYIVETSNGIFEITNRFYELMEKPIPKTIKIEKLAEKFRELWPTGVKTNNGDYIRSSLNALKAKLRTFKNKNPKISDQIILDATQAYVERYALKNYNYIMISSNFIYKHQDSKLETECQAYVDDGVEGVGLTLRGKAV